MATGVYLSSHKKKRTALLLCIFTGMFYVGRFMRGRLKDNNGLPLID